VIADARSVPEAFALEADLCVIGGGAAGITIARAFAGSPVKVVLLESGGLELDGETQGLNKGANVGLPYFPLDGARLRAFGGTTHHWGGVCRPFDPIDFERRPGVPHTGWPIDRATLDPYYPEARKIVGLKSSSWDVEDWDRRDRFEPIELSSRRVHTRVAQTVRKQNRSFGERYRDDVRRASNVTAYLYANVTEIETDRTGTAATRVAVRTLAGTGFSVSARSFVLAVGGIENARLLLVSRGRHERGLGNQNDLVGRFFLEHPRFDGATVLLAGRRIKTRFYEPHRVDGTSIQGYLAATPETKLAESLADVQIKIRPVYEEAFRNALDSDDADDVRDLLKDAERGKLTDEFGSKVASVTGDLMTWRKFVVPGAPLPVPYPEVARRAMRSRNAAVKLIPAVLGDVAATLYEEVAGSAPLEALALTTRLEPVPNPESRVSLTRDRDPLGIPRVQLDWRLTRQDKDSLIRTLEITGAALARAGLGRLQMLVDDGPEWPSDLAGGWHHMGTTRMSDSAREGVVDRDCRVHGMSNLFVAGSSVFPTAGSGTPTMTIVALALRLCDHLRETVFR
jgi:choline dehydrogenase-like flavoprotein